MRTFKVWCPDRGETQDDALVLVDIAPEYAVEEWAEQDDRDSAEYSICRGNEETVCVLELDTTNIRKFLVSGEAVPSYSAYEVVT